uniref:Ferritin n=1 Tax=Ulva fasciata TaxID=111617 RepID=D0PNJ0_9CHLO|nr:ferritin [Ulva fasciata]
MASRCTVKPMRTARAVPAVAAQQRRVRAKAAQEVTGMVFQPFSEVQSELSTVNDAPVTQSYARVDYHPSCEAAMNEQINIEYTISYVYHALHSYFARDNVGLPGFAKFFSEASEEERGHAQLLMDYQVKRGGRVELKPLSAPEMEFANDDKGEALYAMELALSLEKLNFQKLQALHAIADENQDPALCDFIEGELLQEQVDSVKQHAEYVSQLRRVGKGVGVYIFDRELDEGEGQGA